MAEAPGFIKDIAEALPLKHVIDGVSGALISGRGLADNWEALAVIGLWAAAGIALAVRGFSWDEKRR